MTHAQAAAAEGLPSIDPAVEIREAKVEDASLIVEMSRALAAYQGQEKDFTATEEDIRRDGFGEHPRFMALIAEARGKPLGLAVYFDSYSTWEGHPGLFIHDLFVAEEARGHGVGFALVREITRIAKARGCSHLQLNVVHANRARDFYDRLGFAHVDDMLTYRLGRKAFETIASA